MQRSRIAPNEEGQMKMMKRIAACAAVALVLIATASAEPASPHPGALKIEEIRLGPWDAALRAVLSQDGRHVAYAIRRGVKVCVFVDDQPGAEYDAIGKNSPIFDPDGDLEYLAIKDDWFYRVKYVPAQ